MHRRAYVVDDQFRDLSEARLEVFLPCDAPLRGHATHLFALSRRGQGVVGVHSKRISNKDLLASLMEALRHEGTLISRVVTMLIDVEERRLHLEAACSSMFEFCRRKLGMSEGEAFRRTVAARLAKRFPSVLEALRQRRIHLSNLVLLKDILTEENVHTLIEAIEGQTKRAVQELVARSAPKPDAPSRIRKLPDPKPATEPVTEMPGDDTPAAAKPKAPAPAPASEQLVPLSEARHKVQFTASSALREKLEYARALMRHSHISGDLAVIVERAIDLLIAKLEKQKLGAGARANASSRDARPASAAPTSIRAAVRREVVRRDDAQCTFVSDSGERCTARELLELDHRHPRALGGANDAPNLRLLCRAHNQYAAERIFGREHVVRAIHLRRNKPPLEKGAQTALELP